MAAQDLPPVPYQTPVMNKGGALTEPWAVWFRQLFTRVGGFRAKTNLELDLNGTKTFNGSGVPSGSLPGSSVGDYYINNDNKYLYEKTATNTWTYRTTLAGADGSAATVALGTTSTGAPGSSASVTNSGSTSAAVFNFTIPRGSQGDAGDGSVPYYIDDTYTIPIKRQALFFQQVTIAPGGSLIINGRGRIL